jgi:alpha-amylase/alpha-mannosidase (GH57 family)
MADKFKVVLCWHMHQPDYYNSHTQQYQLPWTYLHGIKDYVEMAAHLEAIPKARAVVNFAPTLLEQLDDYVKQTEAFLRDATPLRDPLLAALISSPPYAPFRNGLPHQASKQSPKLNYSPKTAACLQLIEQCLRANPEQLIQRFKPYQALAELANSLNKNKTIFNYLDEQYLIDLVMWYHLAWLGEMVRCSDVRVQALIEKGQAFNEQDRMQLFEIISELLKSIVPRYTKLAEQGQIELSVTPYAHPIMPLLLDICSAQEALSEVDLKGVGCYPDGKERVRWHMHEGIKCFEQHFGRKPEGCWPSEGSVSETVIRLMEEFDIRWIASGGKVLQHSLKQAELEGQAPHRPYCLPNSSVRCFFRDDYLSDLIGFEFSKWHGDDAVTKFIEHLENMACNASQTGETMVSVILDGENAWEYYPHNAYYFLNGLYTQLAEHPNLELTTFSDCLDENVTELPVLVAGSWVHGTFSTWIGEPDKNRGWHMLIEAKHVFDRVSPRLSPEQRMAAERQLALCEGSDWCWWFGDSNPTEAVQDFDNLYRIHLSHLYRLLGETPPAYLAQSFTHGGGDPAAGGVMRKGKEE